MLIRMCVAEKKPISEIVEMMKEDGIDMGDETQGGKSYPCVNT